jgi:general secretion pathway protein E
MSLLSRLTGGKQPVAAPPAAGRPLQSAIRRVQPPAPGHSATVTVLKQPPKQLGKDTPQYRQLSDVPAYSEVASAAGRRYALNSKTQETMVVLKLSGADNLYTVLATKETFGAAGYLGIMQRIAGDGFKVKGCGIADGPMVTRLYAEASNSSVLDDEAIKPIVRSIDKVVEDALDDDASDIHIEKRAAGVKVRFRINGRLELYTDAWTREFVEQMARALHTIADEDSKDVTFSTDGQMSVSRTVSGNQRVKLRVQMSSAYPDEGQDIVMRVLRVAASANVRTLKELGYAPDHLTQLEYMLSSPGGLICVVGTTGSGKSTTLQTMMMDIRKSDSGLKMITVEDPPEYAMEDVTQIPVSRRRGSTENPFVAPMRNALRMDPDVLMPGEIRDAETAALLGNMVQSGHKALTTLHADSVFGAIGRLHSMGMDLDVLGGRTFISGLIFQTLVPVLCKHCKVDYRPDMKDISPALHARIAHVVEAGDTIFVEAPNPKESPNPCKHCNGRGISGRTVCAEMLVPDATIKECIRTNDMTRAYDHWRLQRAGKQAGEMAGATALEHGLAKMREGMVSPIAVEKALGLLHDFALEASPTGAETGDLLGLAH